MVISTPWHFSRPALAEQYLRLLTSGLVQTTTIFAPRRAGKTQFLRRDLTPHAQSLGFTVAYADLWQTQSPALALLQALEEAAEPVGAWARVRGLFKPVNSVKASAQAAGVTGELQVELVRPNAAALTEISLRIDELIAKISARRHLLILIDEAQVLARHPEGVQLARSLRTALTKHADKTRALFTGSSRSELNIVFSNANAPLYSAGHAVHDFPMLGEDFVAFICAKFNASSTRHIDLEAAMASHVQFHYRPEALVRCVVSMLLEPALTLEDATRQEAQRLGSPEAHAGVWAALTALQRELVRQCADNPAFKPFSRESIAVLAIRLGVPTLKASAIQKALAGLSSKTVLNKTAGGGWEFENAHFRDWVKSLPD